MSEWGSGYVTDVAYMPGYYRHQSPSILSLACVLNSVAGIDPAADEPLSYLELGCGLGYGAMALAAANPSWRVTAIDFNPGHVAVARALAREARLANVQFLEADLATLAEDPRSAAIPESDVVSLHGLWSWVPEPVRRGIVRLLHAKVRPGGMVHVSYNVLPAWQGALGMQRAMREAGRRLATRSDKQAQMGLQFVHALVKAEAPQVKGYSFATAMLEKLNTVPLQYLAHEYMNGAWKPCFHADVAADMAEAKLEFVGSAQLLENFRQLTFTDAQRELLDRFDEPVMLELIKDMCLDRGLRHDVFVRGARRLSAAGRNEALGEVTLALTRLPENVQFEAVVPAGRASMEAAFYKPIVTALGEGPRPVRDLLDLPEVVGRRDNPAELIGLLVGTDQAMPVTPRAAAGDDPGTRFNRVAARRLGSAEMLNAGVGLACTRWGTVLTVPMLDLLVFGKLEAADGKADPDAWAAEFASGREDSERQRLREFLGRVLEEKVPLWNRLGVLEQPAGADP